MTLGVHLGRPLQEIDAMPFIDSLLLLQGIYDERHRQLKIDAALHGAKLR